MFDCQGTRRRRRERERKRAEHSCANRTRVLSSLLGDSVALEEPLAQQRAPDPLAWDPLLPLCAGTGRHSPGKNGGSFVPVCARPASLAGIGSAATHRSRGTWGEPWGDCTGTGTWGRQGPVAPAVAQGAASLQKPARSRGDAEETPRGSPPPPPIAQFGAAPPRGDKGLGSGLQPPAPLPKKGFFPIPTCLCCFSSFFSFSFSSFSLWQSSLEARSWEQGGLVQSPPCHPLCPWGEGCCNALWECPHQSPPSDPQERGRKKRQMKGDALAGTSSSKTTSLAFLSPLSPYSEMGTGTVTLGMSTSDIPRVDTVLPVLLVAPSAAHLVVGDDQLLLQLFQLLLQLFLLLIHPLPVAPLPLEVLFENLHLAGGRDVGEPG